MIQIKKYAAIDIGSNAIRLLVTNIVEQKNQEPQFNKSALIRVPIRLGQDAFTDGIISAENIERMCKAIEAYRLLMEVHKVEKYKACATSAMREAKNNEAVVKIIKQKTGITIDIIDGKTEANIIAASDLQQYIKTNENYLYVDVGGGSTEFSLFINGEIKAAQSFKNGTVRLLNHKADKDVWEEIEQWITKHTKNLEHITLIGSGGNINKIFKLSGLPQEKPLSYLYLNTQYQQFSSLSYEERIAKLGLNPDRADVIIPALTIYLKAMKWSGAKEIYVPKIGLSDGIIKAMYYDII